LAQSSHLVMQDFANRTRRNQNGNVISLATYVLP
jgi:hypothetical protein